MIMASALVLLSACNKPGASTGETETGYKVSGKIANAGGGSIMLDELGEQQFISRDTAVLQSDGSFVFEGTVPEPTLYKLNLGPQQQPVLFVLDNKNIVIEADATDLEKTISFKGSPDSELLLALNRLMMDFQTKVQPLAQRMEAAGAAGLEDSLRLLQTEISTIQAKALAQLKNLIRENPESVVSVYATTYLVDPKQDFAFVDSMNTVFASTLPESKYTRTLASNVEKLATSAPGQLAPDFTLPNPEGEPVSLSSLRGKYVMIDFWAAWCGPCRKENPNVVRMYHRFKDKGFEILGVSLDQSKDKWVKAIADDQLPWVQVSDLQGWQSSAAQLYNIEAIPHTVLLDKEGKIIARNLRGAELEQKLESLLL